MTTNEHMSAGFPRRAGLAHLRNLGAPGIGDVADRYGAVDASGPVLWPSLRRRWYLLLLAVLLGSTLGYVVSAARPPVYEATATLQLTDRPFGEDGGEALRPDSATSFVELHATRVLAPDTLRLAADEVAMDERDLAEIVATRPDVAALAVSVVARDTAGTRAAAIADAVALAYDSRANHRATDGQEAAEAALQARIDALDARIDDASLALGASPQDPVAQQRLGGLVTQQLELQQRLDDLLNSRADDIVSTVFPATVPLAPTSPRPVRDAGLAGLAAALAMTAGIWFGATRSSDARSRIGAVVHAPLLAEIRGSRRSIAPWTQVHGDGADGGDTIRLITQALDGVHGDGGAVVFFMGISGEHARRRVAGQTAVVAASEAGRDVTLLAFEPHRRAGRWSVRRRGRPGHWVAARHPSESDVAATVEPVTELAHARDAGSLVIVVGPDVASPEVTNLALASDSVILFVRSRDSVADLLGLRRLLNVTAVPVIGYVYSRRPG